MTATCEKIFRVDCHAHLYPGYDVANWVRSAVSNLTQSETSGNAMPAVVVVDRVGISCRGVLEAASLEGICSLDAILADGSFLVSIDSSPGKKDKLLVIPGTQSIAKEGIEVLGIGSGCRPDEKIPAADQVRSILAAGGLPCIPWSPGKWIGRRGKVVHALLDIFGPHNLAVGDIGMRSTWGPPSPLLTHARSSGFPCLLGSDPLPRRGEESQVGSFGVVVTGTPMSSSGVVAWLLEQLRDPLKVTGAHGSRNSPVTAARRFLSSNFHRPR